MNKKATAIFKFLKDRPKILVGAGLCGILLIFLSGLFSGDGKETAVPAEMSAEQYAQEQEVKLQGMIEELTSSEATVMVTLDTGIEYIYASQAKSDSSEIEENADGSRIRKDGSAESSFVIVQDENGKEVPLVVTRIMPRIKGVVITLHTVRDEDLQNAVSRLVTTALDISESKVCVISSG